MPPRLIAEILRNDRSWVKGTDIAVPLEIGGIEGKDALDGVYAHDGYKSGVIDLDALDAVVFDDLFPNQVDRWHVWEQRQKVLNAPDFRQNFFVREAKPVNVSRASGDVPKFGYILRTRKTPHRSGATGSKPLG